MSQSNNPKLPVNNFIRIFKGADIDSLSNKINEYALSMNSQPINSCMVSVDISRGSIYTISVTFSPLSQ